MTLIIADVLSLAQYLLITLPLCSLACPYCGLDRLWCNGTYPRKSDHEGKLNPIIIQRRYCRGCHRTFSILPECIPPRRWYLWSIQQTAWLMVLSGQSIRSISALLKPSRRTIARWRDWFMDKLIVHRDTLCNFFSELGRAVGLEGFWQACLEQMPLSKAMRLCHESGVIIP
jgi:transposase-like protein